MAKTNQEKKTSTASVKVLDELSEQELALKHRLELRVERSFYSAGVALRELRDRRLYRDTHPDDFIGYCRDRFDKTKQAVNYLIAASQVYENLATTIGCREVETSSTNTNRQVLPTSERQIRDLAGFEPGEQRSIWFEAVDEAEGKVPTSRIVKSVVKRRSNSPLIAADFCEVGDVFIVIKLEGTERKYNGCWALAYDTEGITVGVDVHDRSLRVKPENLKPIDSPEIHRTLPVILKRIRQLRKIGLLDRAAYNVLEDLGRQTYLTEVEEKLLSCLESHYKVKS